MKAYMTSPKGIDIIRSEAERLLGHEEARKIHSSSQNTVHMVYVVREEDEWVLDEVTDLVGVVH